MLLLPGPRVLKPDLRHPLAESRDMGYPLEVLTIGIAVQLEVRLQDGKLFLREGRPDPFRLATFAAVFRIAILRGRGIVSFDHVEVVSFAEQSGIQQGELLPCGQLTRAGVAGETGQVINPFPGPSHPVSCAHASTTLCTFCTESSEKFQVPKIEKYSEWLLGGCKYVRTISIRFSRK